MFRKQDYIISNYLEKTDEKLYYIFIIQKVCFLSVNVGKVQEGNNWP